MPMIRIRDDGQLQIGDNVVPVESLVLRDTTTGQMKDVAGNPVTTATSGFKNLLLNANFSVNTLGQVNGNAAIDQVNFFTFDGWQLANGTDALSWTYEFGVNTLTVPANGLKQTIPGMYIPAGSYTIGWTGTATCTIDGNPVLDGDIISYAGGTDIEVVFSDGTLAKPQLEYGNQKTIQEYRTPAMEAILVAPLMT